MGDATQILSAIEAGNPTAAENLLPLVYAELRRLAAQRLAQEKPGQTLQATALVHEAFLRLVDGEKIQEWSSRRHFFAAAAQSMRQILIDNARRKRRPKLGGDRKRVEFDEACSFTEDRADQLLLLDEALEELQKESPEKAELVKLRYFAGLSHQEAAQRARNFPRNSRSPLGLCKSLSLFRNARRGRVVTIFSGSMRQVGVENRNCLWCRPRSN